MADYAIVEWMDHAIVEWIILSSAITNYDIMTSLIIDSGFPRNEFWNIRYVDNDHEGIPRNSLRI